MESSILIRTCKVYTPEEDNQIRELYSLHTSKEIANIMGLRKSQVKNRINKLGLSLPPDVRIERSKRGQFNPGSIPFTKGKKQIEYMTDEAIERTKASRFIKGQRPHNTKYDGAVTVRRDADGRQYKWIRLSQNKWVHLHRHVWTSEFGIIPDDLVVSFIDGQRMNCVPENLELITRQALLRKNAAEWFSKMKSIWSDLADYKAIQAERIKEKKQTAKAEKKARLDFEKLQRKAERKREKEIEQLAAAQKRELNKLNKKSLLAEYLLTVANIKSQKKKEKLIAAANAFAEKQSAKESKKKLREKVKLESKQRVRDYDASIKITSLSPFYKSVQDAWPQLFPYCVSLVKNKELAQDLLHEMISKHQSDDAISEAELKKLVYGCYLVEQRVVRQLSHNEYALSVIQADSDPDELQTDTNKAVNSLEATDASIARLMFLDELPMEEICTELNLSESQILSRIPEIKKQLQNKLAKYKKYERAH